mmetsp:Transcript_4964/g.13364  ORF Transcript_4964/g.13364 Transcript_4964/m.13364 type:complete len:152 (+) Transcript_4964:117-572(+)
MRHCAKSLSLQLCQVQSHRKFVLYADASDESKRIRAINLNSRSLLLRISIVSCDKNYMCSTKAPWYCRFGAKQAIVLSRIESQFVLLINSTFSLQRVYARELFLERTTLFTQPFNFNLLACANSARRLAIAFSPACDTRVTLFLRFVRHQF